ncbi:MAG: hypothetical protein HY319_28865 [Armatimonadetes bacterium]|nr:hypothetical protein [Armatimonadota bacterium]
MPASVAWAACWEHLGAVLGGTIALATGRCGEEQAAGLALFGGGGLLAGSLLAPSIGWSWALVGGAAAIGGAVGLLHGLTAGGEDVRKERTRRTFTTVQDHLQKRLAKEFPAGTEDEQRRYLHSLLRDNLGAVVRWDDRGRGCVESVGAGGFADAMGLRVGDALLESNRDPASRPADAADQLIADLTEGALRFRDHSFYYYRIGRDDGDFADLKVPRLTPAALRS